MKKEPYEKLALADWRLRGESRASVLECGGRDTAFERSAISKSNGPGQTDMQFQSGVPDSLRGCRRTPRLPSNVAPQRAKCTLDVLPIINFEEPEIGHFRVNFRKKIRDLHRHLLYGGEDAVELEGVILEIAFGPDDEIGAADFFGGGHLRGDTLPDLFRGPAARR